MNTHAPGFNPDDGPADSLCVIDDDRCSECGAKQDFDDLKAVDFQATGGGVQPGTVDGPAVHWAEGTIACWRCGARLWIQVSE